MSTEDLDRHIGDVLRKVLHTRLAKSTQTIMKELRRRGMEVHAVHQIQEGDGEGFRVAQFKLAFPDIRTEEDMYAVVGILTQLQIPQYEERVVAQIHNEEIANKELVVVEISDQYYILENPKPHVHEITFKFAFRTK